MHTALHVSKEAWGSFCHVATLFLFNSFFRYQKLYGSNWFRHIYTKMSSVWAFRLSFHWGPLYIGFLFLRNIELELPPSLIFRWCSIGRNFCNGVICTLNLTINVIYPTRLTLQHLIELIIYHFETEKNSLCK